MVDESSKIASIFAYPWLIHWVIVGKSPNILLVHRFWGIISTNGVQMGRRSGGRKKFVWDASQKLENLIVN